MLSPHLLYQVSAVVLTTALCPITANGYLDEERDRFRNRRRDQWRCLSRQ